MSIKSDGETPVKARDESNRTLVSNEFSDRGFFEWLDTGRQIALN